MATIISPDYSLKEFCQRMIGKDPVEVMDVASAEITYARKLHREKTNQADFRSSTKGRAYCDDLQRLISLFILRCQPMRVSGFTITRAFLQSQNRDQTSRLKRAAAVRRRGRI